MVVFGRVQANGSHLLLARIVNLHPRVHVIRAAASNAPRQLSPIVAENCATLHAFGAEKA